MINTIFAISSGLGKAGVTVFRISGPDAFGVVDMFHISNTAQPFKANDKSNIDAPNNPVCNLEFGKVYLRTLFRFQDNISENDSLNKAEKDKYPIDKVILLFFKGPKSFTGENCVEIHAHGSLAVIDIISKILATKFSPASPGEFTKRALLNGKMSFHEVEGLNDLLKSKTYSQHVLATTQMFGKSNQQHLEWREKLYKILAYIEVYIDFPEEDIPDGTLDLINNIIYSLINDFTLALTNFNRTKKIQDGIKVVIAGKPNAGKSSLINLISNRKVAIVSEIAGTTRDVIESFIEINGYQINLLDTAGFNDEDNDLIEQIGIRLAIQNLQEADIKLIILDSAEIWKILIEIRSFLEVGSIDLRLFAIRKIFDKRILEVLNLQTKETIELYDKLDVDLAFANCIIILNKVDLFSEPEIQDMIKLISFCIQPQNTKLYRLNNSEELKDILSSTEKNLNISTLITENYVNDSNVSMMRDKLISRLYTQIASICQSLDPKENSLLFNLRHKKYIEEAISILHRISKMDISYSNLIFIAEDIRQAIFALEMIIGKYDVDNILEKIFSEFCIGK